MNWMWYLNTIKVIMEKKLEKKNKRYIILKIKGECTK